jgi:photosystem II stability/assembly factor-like uncharacterized protein
VIARAGTADGVFTVDLEIDEVVDFDPDDRVEPAEVDVSLPRLLAASSAGSTVVAVLDARPPLAVSHDAGQTWTQAGGGLPKGRAVAVAEDDPDVVVYGARNRLYLSRDGGRFWSALAPELPEIEAIELSAI